MAGKTNKDTNIINSTKTYDIIEDDTKYTNTILSRLYTDYRKQNLDSCDIQIIINGSKSIYTHKVILQTYSNFFRKMMGTEKIVSLNDPEVNLKTMKLLLRYLYKGVFKTNSEKYFLRVMHLAKKLETRDLYKALSNYHKNSSGIFDKVNKESKRKSSQTDKSIRNINKENKIDKQQKKRSKSNKILAMDDKHSFSKKRINNKMDDSQNKDSRQSKKTRKSTRKTNPKMMKNSIGEKEKNISKVSSPKKNPSKKEKNISKVSSPKKNSSKKEKNFYDNYDSHPLMYSGQQDLYRISYSDDYDDDDDSEN
ncbi:BTB/POZ-like domain and BTB/POZ fold domain and BTB/POZ domain-containing protein [Strongyloides ratti]|uniref:BTB/POZ-like domain and BTB/POZ fold domain and BTB/POZ domain-containing protein n=1 Tax=Strongyloides ratti TaxID=34506 RepID=A0A090LDQ1_STRRB|nr:BTB/POZ-like domain and BTB/POZ fold domain and BTB/POZ domain-containing protein [Strongyloides ratti]CEF67892.1 BTB/POZ-like domain and BTB/POZ fold domain and BTB/POZ domain-containing protein [Strongyloides ratti]